MIGRLRARPVPVEEPADGRGTTLTAGRRRRGGCPRAPPTAYDERFLVRLPGMPWDKVHDEACKLDAVLSPEVGSASQSSSATTSARTATFSAAKDGTLAETELRPLSDLEPGDEAVIGCIAEEKSDLLRYLATLGLLPDTPVAVESVAPFNGPLLVRVGGSQYALGREVTDKIMVRG